MKNVAEIETSEDFDRHFQSEIWLNVAKAICQKHRVSFNQLIRLAGTDHIVFAIDNSLILKVYRPFRNCFEREKRALELVSTQTTFNIPQTLESGEMEGFPYLIMTKLSGILMTRKDWLRLSEKKQISFIRKLAVGLKQVHSLNTSKFPSDWAEFVENRAETFIERQVAHGVNTKILDVLPKFIEENLNLVPKNNRSVFMHSDVHFGNLLISEVENEWHISGLFDFADSRFGFHEYDFLAVGVLIVQGQGEIQREFFRAYGYSDSDLDESFRRRLMMLTMLYETADLRRYALRLKPEAVDFTLDELEKGIWSFAG